MVGIANFEDCLVVNGFSFLIFFRCGWTLFEVTGSSGGQRLPRTGQIFDEPYWGPRPHGRFACWGLVRRRQV